MTKAQPDARSDQARSTGERAFREEVIALLGSGAIELPTSTENGHRLHIGSIADAQGAIALAKRHGVALRWVYGGGDTGTSGPGWNVSLRGLRQVRVESSGARQAGLGKDVAPTPRPPRRVYAGAGALLGEIEAKLRRFGSTLGTIPKRCWSWPIGAWLCEHQGVRPRSEQLGSRLDMGLLDIEWIVDPLVEASGVVGGVTLRCHRAPTSRPPRGWFFATGSEALTALIDAAQSSERVALRIFPLAGLELASLWLPRRSGESSWGGAVAATWPGMSRWVERIAGRQFGAGWMLVAESGAEAGVAEVEFARLDRLVRGCGAIVAERHAVEAAMAVLPTESPLAEIMARQRGVQATRMETTHSWATLLAQAARGGLEGRWLEVSPALLGYGGAVDELVLARREQNLLEASATGATALRSAVRGWLGWGTTRVALRARDGLLDHNGGDAAIAAALGNVRAAVAELRRNVGTADRASVSIDGPGLIWVQVHGQDVLITGTATTWANVVREATARGLAPPLHTSEFEGGCVGDVLRYNDLARNCERCVGVTADTLGTRGRLAAIGVVDDRGALALPAPMLAGQRVALLHRCAAGAVSAWVTIWRFAAADTRHDLIWRGRVTVALAAIGQLLWRVQFDRVAVAFVGDEAEVRLRIDGSGALQRRALDHVAQALPGVMVTHEPWPVAEMRQLSAGPPLALSADIPDGCRGAVAFSPDRWTPMMADFR